MLEGYREFCRSLHVELRENRIESPLENLPYLYELWGTLRVALKDENVQRDSSGEITASREQIDLKAIPAGQWWWD